MTDGYKIKRVLTWVNGVEKQIYPAGWKPGANTLAYYPLNSTTTVNDMSGNNRNLTNNGGITFGTNGGIDCASFSNSDNVGLTLSSTGLTGNPVFTFSVFINRKGYGTVIQKSQVFMLGPINSSAADVGVAINGNGANDEYQYWSWGVSDVNTGVSNNADTWEYITFTNDGTTKAFYVNGTKVKEGGLNINITGGNLSIGSFPTSFAGTGYQRFYGYMSEFILESKCWTESEILNYYNSTKSKYGL